MHGGRVWQAPCQLALCAGMCCCHGECWHANQEHVCTDEAHAQAVAPAAPLGVVGWAALGGFLAGFAMETVADAQKFAFKNKSPDRYSTPCKMGHLYLECGILLCARMGMFD